jgi:hypothetical protein
MSACMRSLNSSDQWAPGLSLLLLVGCGGGGGGVLLSRGDFRAPTLSVSVAREDVGLEGECELFMQLSVAPFGSVGAGNVQFQAY